MCLVAKAEIRTASRAITCYKRLVKYRNGVLKSPYYGEEYKIGETKKVECFTDGNGRNIRNRTKVKEINAGLHAYTTLKRALNVTYYTTVRCVIPKGTKYVRGIGGDIVALKLIVKEIVNV